jgi:alpha-mannosidase
MSTYTQKLKDITIERVEKFIDASNQWNDVNLASKLYSKRDSTVIKLAAYSVPNPSPNHTDSFKYSDALNQSYTPIAVGHLFGPSWSTHWVKAEITIPEDFEGEEVYLIWDCGCEAMIWENGEPQQGLCGGTDDNRRAEYLLAKGAKAGQKYNFMLEVSCTGMFGNPGAKGFLCPPTADKKFTLVQCEIVAIDNEVKDLLFDLQVITDMAKLLPAQSNRAWQATETARKMTNTIFVGDRTSYKKAKEIANEFLKLKNGQSQHTIYASGHCHIDTAWLWTYSETRRKCARSWSTQIRYMAEYPEYKFVASQAQQFAWMKENYPGLFKRMQDKAKDGKFVPTGGTWVEMDCNIPSGESLVRQFLLGQKFFEKEFGHKCTEFWLPDTFGYSAQLPQIIKGSGMEFFLTQKLSWNLFNKMPSNTFYWQGLDGTSVLTHFPPADTYCSEANVKEILYTVENFKNKDKSNETVLLYGRGDGGGGPRPDMLERLTRFRDLDGMPKVEMSTPFEYFKKVKSTADDIPTWVGELYFELHQGTYTTQAKNKLYNRKNEFLLRGVEILATIANLEKHAEYPAKELDYLWKQLLLNQFHDVIPGSSIGAVYVDSNEHYAEMKEKGEALLKQTLHTLTTEASLTEAAQKLMVSHANAVAVINTLAWARQEVVELPESLGKHAKQMSRNNKPLGVVSALPVGVKVEKIDESHVAPVTFTVQNDKSGNKLLVLENSELRAQFKVDGTLVSLVHKATGRESIELSQSNHGANHFVLFEDMPFFWDAWDVFVYHTEKRHEVVAEGQDFNIVEQGPLRVGVEFNYKLGEHSQMKQYVTLDAVSSRLEFNCSVEWHENRKFLKVEFPLAVHNDFATYSSQFGHIRRPTHRNTSWDLAKFEVCGHHWADLSEYGFGVALLNDCKYGYTTENNVMRLSLLRSPKLPDETADMGHHYFKFALMPHEGDIFQANLVQHGYNFNEPLIVMSAANKDVRDISYFNVDKNNLVLETIKLPESHSANEVIVRVWESFGGRGTATLNTCFAFDRVAECNLLEEDVASDKSNVVSFDAKTVTFKFKPFQVLTFKLSKK